MSIPPSNFGVLSSQFDSNWTTLPPTTSPYHAAYHPLFEIDSFLYQLEREHPSLMSVFRVGISGEGRELLGVEISSSGWTDSEAGSMETNRKKRKRGEKMGFVITGAQHAREVSHFVYAFLNYSIN
jgi:hypothetical protein